MNVLKTPAQLFEEKLYKTVAYKLVTVKLWVPGQPASPITNFRYFFPSDSGLDRSIITSIQAHSYDGDIAEGINPGFGDPNQLFITNATLPNFTLTLVDHDGNHVWENQALASLSTINCGKYIKRLYNRIKTDQCYITSLVPFSFVNPPPGNVYYVPLTIGYIPPK